MGRKKLPELDKKHLIKLYVTKRIITLNGGVSACMSKAIQFLQERAEKRKGEGK